MEKTKNVTNTNVAREEEAKEGKTKTIYLPQRKKDTKRQLERGVGGYCAECGRPPRAFSFGPVRALGFCCCPCLSSPHAPFANDHGHALLHAHLLRGLDTPVVHAPLSAGPRPGGRGGLGFSLSPRDVMMCAQPASIHTPSLPMCVSPTHAPHPHHPTGPRCLLLHDPHATQQGGSQAPRGGAAHLTHITAVTKEDDPPFPQARAAFPSCKGTHAGTRHHPEPRVLHVLPCGWPRRPSTWTCVQPAADIICSRRPHSPRVRPIHT